MVSLKISYSFSYTNRDLFARVFPHFTSALFIKGAFVWDEFEIRIIGIMRVSVRLGAILIPEYLKAILLPGAE